VLQYIWQEYKVFPKFGIAALILRIITVILHLFPALYYRDIINLLSSSVASNEIASHAIAILMYIFWIKLVSAICHRLMDYFLVTFEMDIQEDLYNRLFEYLQKHSFQFFSDNFTGSLISKIRKCVGSFERFTDTLNRNVIPFVLSIIIILIIVGTQYLWLGL
jgi:ABC-type multidrug transport system fused ATPase/permease subunit